MKHTTRFMILACALFILPGMEGCPLFDTQPPDASLNDGGVVNDDIDLGGTAGALWRVTFSTNVLLSLKASGQTYSKQVPITSSYVSLSGSQVHVNYFCTRQDTLCPNSLLPPQPGILQDAKTPGYVLVGFNRVGPLAILKNQSGLIGSLSGNLLSIPLGTIGLAGTKGQHCVLLNTSRLEATAGSFSSGGKVANSLEGYVILSYTSDCLNLGGISTVQSGAVLEMNMSFTAKRL